jgi:hypothetical protein
MDAAAKLQPELDSEELGLLVELLEREGRDLPGEIHHTRTAAFREQLRRRRDVVDRLLARLRPQVRE